MNDLYKRTLERLDASYPPPKETLTLEEVAQVIEVKLKTLRNHASTKQCPFPILKIGGKIVVSKIVIAQVLAGINPFEEQEKPEPRRGRPKNSERLLSFAWRSLCSILDQNLKQERAELESVSYTNEFRDRTYI